MKSRTLIAASLMIFASASSVMAATPHQNSTEFCRDVNGDDWASFEKIKAVFLGDDDTGKSSVIHINLNRLALVVIGSCLVDEQGHNVAKVTDIIIDQDGKALFIVVNSSLTIEKEKINSYSYESISRVGTDADMIMPLSDKALESAKPFFYDAIDTSSDEHLILGKAYSLSKILEGNLLDSGKDVVAKIENISIKNGKVNYIIVSFNVPNNDEKKNVVLDFSDTQLVRRGEILNLQMDVNRSDQFKTYKETITQK